VSLPKNLWFFLSHKTSFIPGALLGVYLVILLYKHFKNGYKTTIGKTYQNIIELLLSGSAIYWGISNFDYFCKSKVESESLNSGMLAGSLFFFIFGISQAYLTYSSIDKDKVTAAERI
jgi:hypothetical protein